MKTLANSVEKTHDDTTYSVERTHDDIAVYNTKRLKSRIVERNLPFLDV